MVGSLIPPEPSGISRRAGSRPPCCSPATRRGIQASIRSAGRPTQGRGRAGYREVGNLMATDHVMNEPFRLGMDQGLTGEMFEYTAGQVATACGRTHS